jgi:tetratricopeptide (TPR) repeat protein
MIFLERRAHGDAIDYLERSLNGLITPNTWYGLALTYLDCGKIDDGIRNLKNALNVDPSFLDKGENLLQLDRVVDRRIKRFVLQSIGR